MLKSSISGGFFVRVDGVRAPTVTVRPCAIAFDAGPKGTRVGMDPVFISDEVLHG